MGHTGAVCPKLAFCNLIFDEIIVSLQNVLNSKMCVFAGGRNLYKWWGFTPRATNRGNRGYQRFLGKLEQKLIYSSCQRTGENLIEPVLW